MSIRKFKMLDRVRVVVCRETHPSMRYFDSGFEAIVAGDGHASLGGYSLYKIKNGQVVDCCAWYEEDQLTLVESDIEENHRMVTAYRWPG